ncbi:MAG: hypothetical protein ACRDK2_10115 [Solirubrobacteraceae bacterium]
MTVLGSIPIQIPVHRIRVTASCLATGGPVHTAALRLMDTWGHSPEEIAEPLGLPIPYVEKLLDDLERGGEPVEREFVVWVDSARGRILPHSALSGIAVKPSKDAPFTMPMDPPLAPDLLAGMGLQAGLSWDLGLEGYVEVLDVLGVVTDIRDRSLPHVLRLPDTQLIISTPEIPEGSWEIAVAQHGAGNPELTAWARLHYAEDIDKHLHEGDLESPITPPAEVGHSAEGSHWRTHEPHPGRMRQQVTHAAESAQERLVLCAPDLRNLPMWLGETLEDVADREVEVVLCTPGDRMPQRADFQFTAKPLSEQSSVLTVIADEDRAVVHSEPDACLDRAATATQQAFYTTDQESVIGRLLDRLGVGRLRRRPRPSQLTPQIVASMLASNFQRLRVELPRTVQAEIQPEDEQFALETIDRNARHDGPTQAARKAAAGIAWERVLIARVSHLASNYEQLGITAVRWKPPGVNLDLDVIVHDATKGIVWILDAKNAKRKDSQIKTMRDQIVFLEKAPELTAGCPRIIGAIVHHRSQLPTPAEPTEDPNILRCTLQGLQDLLLARQLPGERHNHQTQRKAA